MEFINSLSMIDLTKLLNLIAFVHDSIILSVIHISLLTNLMQVVIQRNAETILGSKSL